MQLRMLMLEDDYVLGIILPGLFADLDITVTLAQTDADAKEAIRAAVLQHAGFDVITTDIVHPHEGGIAFLQWLRRLPDNAVFGGGLRARHTPVVVHSAVASADSERGQEIAAIDRDIVICQKPASFEELAAAIDLAISTYRHNIMADLDHVGIGITVEGGQYKVVDALCLRDGALESKYIAGPARSAGQVVRRLMLSLDRLAFSERGIEELEWLLNHKDATETVLHQFFLTHPEFLLTGEYAWYWSQPRLRGVPKSICPDFVLQPWTGTRTPWNWTVLDLKSPQVSLLRSGRFHPDFTSDVHRVVAQLRDYADFFANPANTDAIKERFGSVLPSPRLVAVIGRDPSGGTADYARAIRRLPDVRLYSYDEVLEFRRAQVQKLRDLVHSAKPHA